MRTHALAAVADACMPVCHPRTGARELTRLHTRCRDGHARAKNHNGSTPLSTEGPRSAPGLSDALTVAAGCPTPPHHIDSGVQRTHGKRASVCHVSSGFSCQHCPELKAQLPCVSLLLTLSGKHPEQLPDLQTRTNRHTNGFYLSEAMPGLDQPPNGGGDWPKLVINNQCNKLTRSCAP